MRQPRTLAVLTALAVAALAILPAGATQSQAAQVERARVQEERARLEAEMARIQAEIEQTAVRLRAELQAAQQETGVVAAAREQELREAMRLNEVRMAELRRQLARRTADMTRRLAEEERRVVAEAQRARARVAPRIRIDGRSVYVGCDELADAMLDVAEELELTDTQVETIRDAERQSRRDAIGRNADIQVAEMDLDDLYGADEPDLAAIEAKLREISELEIAAEMSGLQLRQQLRGVLTPEQRTEFDDMGSERRVTEVRIISSAHGRIDPMGC